MIENNINELCLRAPKISGKTLTNHFEGLSLLDTVDDINNSFDFENMSFISPIVEKNKINNCIDISSKRWVSLIEDKQLSSSNSPNSSYNIILNTLSEIKYEQENFKRHFRR